MQGVAGPGQGEAAIEQEHELASNQRGQVPFLSAVACVEGAQDLPDFRRGGRGGAQRVEDLPLSSGQVDAGQRGIELCLQ